MKNRLLVAVSSLFLTVTAAQADTLYTDEATFLGAAGTLALESFEGITGSGTSLALADFSMSTNGALSVQTANPGHPSEGIRFVRWFANSNTGTVTFTFSYPVLAFGLTLSDALDGGAHPSLTIETNSGGGGFTALTGLQANESTHFAGVIGAHSFTEVIITNLGGNPDNIGLDEVHYTPATVPEPGTPLLTVVGLMGVDFVRRRRRS